MGAERISSYSEATSIRKWESSSHGALNASALGKSTRTSAASYGCNAIVLLATGITHANIDVAFLLCTNQARKAKTGHKSFAHALGQSGVVRPSHIEPRYFIAQPRIDALYREETRLDSGDSIIDVLSLHFLLTSPSRNSCASGIPQV